MNIGGLKGKFLANTTKLLAAEPSQQPRIPDSPLHSLFSAHTNSKTVCLRFQWAWELPGVCGSMLAPFSAPITCSVEILGPNVVVLGGEVLGRQLDR